MVPGLDKTFQQNKKMKLFNFLKSKTKLKPEIVEPDFVSHNVKISAASNEKFLYTSTTTLSTVLDFIKHNSKELGIYLTGSASEIDIAKFEENITILPDDFKLLYKLSNGFETDEDLFRLIPLDEIISRGKDSYLISNASFHFTEYMIYCDMWTVDINTENSNSYRIYNKTNDVVFLTNSLAEFLAIFINKGIYDGLYQWREDIIKQTR